jgi:hypothetical protein
MFLLNDFSVVWIVTLRRFKKWIEVKGEGPLLVTKVALL